MYSLTSSSDGSRNNSPVSPSIIITSPSFTSPNIPFTPTTAGNSSDLAIIAE